MKVIAFMPRLKVIPPPFHPIMIHYKHDLNKGHEVFLQNKLKLSTKIPRKEISFRIFSIQRNKKYERGIMIKTEKEVADKTASITSDPDFHPLNQSSSHSRKSVGV